MKLIEVLLRLGCALVGWMVVFTHIIWLATLRVTGCESSADELWRLLFTFSAFTIVFALLLPVSVKMREVHQILRWFAVPLGGLALFALSPIYQAMVLTTMNGLSLCEQVPQAWWHVWWAPSQLVVLAVVAWGVFRVWNPSV